MLTNRWTHLTNGNNHPFRDNMAELPRIIIISEVAKILEN
jgi:hypothetical protein